jgi:thiamine-phosphate pyrophosphorylase
MERIVRVSCTERLQLITSGSFTAPAALVGAVQEALQAGARWIQLRDKQASARELVEQARRLLPLCRQHRAKLIINDRLDVALLVRADGVHLGTDDLPWAEARRLAPPPFLLGVSVDSPELLQTAIEAHADYCGVGPAYETATKPDAGQPQPIELYRELVRQRGTDPIALIAVGGISPGNVRPLLEAGVDGVAVSRAVFESAQRGAVIRQLLTELGAQP